LLKKQKKKKKKKKKISDILYTTKIIFINSANCELIIIKLYKINVI